MGKQAGTCRLCIRVGARFHRATGKIGVKKGPPRAGPPSLYDDLTAPAYWGRPIRAHSLSTRRSPANAPQHLRVRSSRLHADQRAERARQESGNDFVIVRPGVDSETEEQQRNVLIVVAALAVCGAAVAA